MEERVVPIVSALDYMDTYARDDDPRRSRHIWRNAA
jgi:hypothetical protein